MSATPAVAPRLLAPAMLAVDIGFLAYWTVLALGLLPPELRFTGYEDPVVAAWNWSFMPLDVAASLTGMTGLAAMRQGAASGALLVPVSLALTAAAGGMAVAFWALLGWFDPTWWMPNLALLAIGLGGLLALGSRSPLAAQGTLPTVDGASQS